MFLNLCMHKYFRCCLYINNYIYVLFMDTFSQFILHHSPDTLSCSAHLAQAGSNLLVYRSMPFPHFSVEILVTVENVHNIAKL